MRSAIEHYEIWHNSNSIKVSVSIGATDLQASIDKQIKAADELLYTAKQQGKNQVIFARNNFKLDSKQPN
jgi:PleD family two-component response regulator